MKKLKRVSKNIVVCIYQHRVCEMPADLCRGQRSQRAMVAILIDLLRLAHVTVEQPPIVLVQVELAIRGAGMVPDLSSSQKFGCCHTVSVLMRWMTWYPMT